MAAHSASVMSDGYRRTRSGFLEGVREQANRLIEQSMQEWDRVSQGPVQAG
ncbi:hypothetical protein [Streptomyces sp. NPDC023838]|uniref:hypothetical protein n=1 Tax=Streptomyces sp. NPDC023838 TaxID=3154325 RepID=UPI0033D93D78